MHPQNKHNARTIVGVVILGFLCLMGIIIAPQQTAGSVFTLCTFIVFILLQKRKVGNVEAQKPIASSRYRQISALCSLLLGFISFLTSPFAWSVGFAAISLILAVLVLSGQHYDQQPSVTASISSAFAMSVVGLILSFMTFVMAAIMWSFSSWPTEPTMFIRGIFAN